MSGLKHGEMDARVWAREWCRIAREIEAANDGRAVIDEEWMVSWFANALMSGFDYRTWQTPEYKSAMGRVLRPSAEATA